MSEKPTLSEFWDDLNRHDWYYDYSDDGAVWRAGSANLARLQGLAKTSPEHQAMFDGFRKHHFSGEPWGTEKAAKPERPND